MKKEKGFYPWIKSIFSKKQKTNAEGVYAGPDQMKGRRRPAFTKCVYAGPPRNRKEIEAVYAGPEPMNDVYAGPEFFEQTKPEDPVDEPVENGTDPAGTPEPPAPEMPVYAGPEPMDPPQPTPDMPAYAGPEPAEPTEPDEPPMGRVYAGPERYEKNDTPIMLVYAGPEYFNPRPRILHGAPAPEAKQETPAEPDDTPVPEGSVRCPSCGFVYDAIFCPECGTPRPKDE